MDTELVKVTFVPEAPTGRRLADREMWRRQLTVEGHGRRDASVTTGNRTATTAVEDVVTEFVGVIRRHHQLARQLHRRHIKGSTTTTTRRAGRRHRIVGVYVTDGRSLDTAGTVYQVDRVTRRLHRSVALFAVGVGREISGAQLTSVTGGRLDRVLTVFTGSSTKQSFDSLRKLSNRLSRLICRRR